MNEVALGAGEIPKGPFPQSLPYVNQDQEYYYNDLEKATEYFKKAFDGEVWEKGFKVGIVYNTGNDARKTALEILEYNIERINPKFQVDVIGLEWATVLDRLRSASLPIFVMGWLADFPDTHNFAVPFMHSAGTFAGYCGQGLIDLAKEKFDGLISLVSRPPTQRSARRSTLSCRKCMWIWRLVCRSWRQPHTGSCAIGCRASSIAQLTAPSMISTTFPKLSSSSSSLKKMSRIAFGQSYSRYLLIRGTRMLTYIARRLLFLPVVLIGVTLMIFVAMSFCRLTNWSVPILKVRKS